MFYDLGFIFSGSGSRVQGHVFSLRVLDRNWGNSTDRSVGQSSSLVPSSSGLGFNSLKFVPGPDLVFNDLGSGHLASTVRSMSPDLS